MIKEFNLYNDIVILEENSNRITYIGTPLLEDDHESEDNAKKGLFLLIKEKIVGLFSKDKSEIAKVEKKMTSTDPNSIKSPTGFLKWFGTKILTLLKNGFNTVMKALRIAWNWIKNNVPGVNAIATKVAKMLGKEAESGVTVGNEKLSGKEIIGLGATTVVLVGTIGYILKKFSNKSGMNESTIIYTKPFALVESDGSIKESFVKKAPTLFGKLIDFMKNVKDHTIKFIIAVLGTMIGVGLFMLLAIISKPMMCKVIRYALLVDAAGISNQITGGAKMKYISAKVALAMANTIGNMNSMILYDSCDCVNWDAKAKRYVYNPGNGCESIDAFRKKVLSGQ